MPTPGERQALLFVAAVAALGVGVRTCRAVSPAPQDEGAKGALAAQIAQVDSAIAAGGARRPRSPPLTTRRSDTAGTSRPRAEMAPRTAPPVPLGPVDVDVASLEELDRLPGIGPALAARIIEDRELRGPFGSMDALQQVRGIGPSLAERLRPHVTFSHPPRPHDTEVPAETGTRRRRRP